MPEQGATRLGAYALAVSDDGALLLARMTPDAYDAGRWTLPGGGAQAGDSAGPSAR